MNKLSIFAAAVLLATSSAMAATLTDDFKVTLSFTGACQVKTAATDMTLTYPAFATEDQTASTSTTFECSRGLSPTFSLNTGTNQTASAAAAAGAGLTGEGVIQGVRYTLTGTTSRSVTGDAASAGANGTGGSNGTADEYKIDFEARMAAGQAGTGGGTGGVHTRVLTISY